MAWNLNRLYWFASARFSVVSEQFTLSGHQVTSAAVLFKATTSPNGLRRFSAVVTDMSVDLS
jgi:hypothetical protein